MVAYLNELTTDLQKKKRTQKPKILKISKAFAVNLRISKLGRLISKISRGR